MKLSKRFVESYQYKTVPWGPIGYVVYKRTYARDLGNRTEEWWETVERCVNGVLDISPMSIEDAEMLYDYVFNFKCCFSGRSLWQLGTPNIERFGGDSLVNCWTVAINDPIKPFCFAFDELMLGGGVGFNIQSVHVYSLPEIKNCPNIQRVTSDDCDFIVPDNREGWVKLLSKVLKRFFYGGGDLSYSTSCIRPRGQKISSFGGTASGGEELVKGIEQITKILRSRYLNKLRPIDCLDIMNILGSIVVSGNVRRSAQIALGDSFDHQFISAKNWNLHQIPNWRAMSNNSVIISDVEQLSPEFWDGYNGNGEPLGLINLDNCRTYGRLCDGENYRPDPSIVGVNPCGEIPLANYEACNLAEIFLPNIKNVYEFTKAAALMYQVCKAITNVPYIYEETAKIVHKNRRIGISVTGYAQSEWKENEAIFQDVYNYLDNLDRVYSHEQGISTSVKLTTVKPSGTLSLLAGVTPGCHAAYSDYYIRRVSMSSEDKLAETCKKHGYNVTPKLNMDGTPDLKTLVVSFPIKTPDDTTLAEELTAVDQLETLKFLQNVWADNSVSITIYYRKNEISEIRDWLRVNWDYIKSVSFLLHNEHGFAQAPYEKITKEKYYELISGITPITKISESGEIESMECSSGGCPIR